MVLVHRNESTGGIPGKVDTDLRPVQKELKSFLRFQTMLK